METLVSRNIGGVGPRAVGGCFGNAWEKRNVLAGGGGEEWLFSKINPCSAN